MSVSVIIINWNSGDLLAECLQHIKKQTVYPERIIVVDNGSTDGSGDSCHLLDNVVVLKMSHNCGFAAGNNHALALCTSEFVALLNPDAFPAPDWLEQLLKAANEHPDVAAFGSRQLCYEDHDIIDGTGDCYHISGLVWRKRHGMHHNTEDMVVSDIFSPCAAAALYRRNALLAIGGFDEDYFCYAEDVDVGFRLRLTGCTAMYVPWAVVYHMGSATTGGRHSDFSVYHGHRNLVWTYFKNMPGMLFWYLLPVHLLLNIVTLGLFTLRGQFSVIMKAKCDAIKGIPKIWTKRKKIQNERSVHPRHIWLALDKHLLPERK